MNEEKKDIVDEGVTPEVAPVEELVPEEVLPENEAPVDTAEEIVEPADADVPAEEVATATDEAVA